MHETASWRFPNGTLTPCKSMASICPHFFVVPDSHILPYYQDRTFSHMTHEEWTSALAPKVTGTWNLHQALGGHKLDFFLMTGSLSGTVGNKGQANYAAANTFLNAFTRYRRQQGLHASVVDLRPFDESSAASKTIQLGQRLGNMGWIQLNRQQLVASIQLAISEGHACDGSGIYSNELLIGCREGNPRDSDGSSGADARFALYKDLHSDNNPAANQRSDDQFRMLCRRIEGDPTLLDQPDTAARFTQEIVGMITNHTSQGVDMDLEHANEVSIDSLMSIEIKSYLGRHLGLHLTVEDISKAATAGALTELIIQRLKSRYQACT